MRAIDLLPDHVAREKHEDAEAHFPERPPFKPRYLIEHGVLGGSHQAQDTLG